MLQILKFYTGFFGAGLLFGVNVASPILQNQYNYGYSSNGGYQVPNDYPYGPGWGDSY